MQTTIMFTFGRKPLMGLDDDLYVGDGEFPYGLLEEEDPEDSDMDPSWEAIESMGLKHWASGLKVR